MNKYVCIIAIAGGNVKDFSHLKCKFFTGICNEKS